MEVHHSNRIVTGFAWLIVISLLMVMIFGDDTDPVAKWLKHWETLITGLLAIFAAIVTLRQMKLSDQAAEARHRHDARLALRVDRQLARRAAVPTNSELIRWANETEELVQRFHAADNSTDIGQPNLDIMEPFANKVAALASIISFNEGEVGKAEPLFDPIMNRTWLKLKKASKRLSELNLLQQSVEPSNDSIFGKKLSDTKLRQNIKKGLFYIRPAIPLARDFAKQLSCLSASYDETL
jgi:hypothetical protein